jgi:DNA-binding NarL/FixJ family response regulator
VKRTRAILADDHAMFLDGIRRLLEPDADVVGTAVDGHALVELVAQLKPDLVVADIGMPVLNGLDALRKIRAQGLKTRFIFLTGNLDAALATQAVRLGASGYVLKHSASEELVTAVRSAQSGQTYITPRIAREVMHNLMSGAKSDGPVLTAREREVLQLLAEGRTLKEAASALGVSPRTIEFHRNNIADKTGLRTTAELARYAAREGIVPDGL